MLKMRLSVMELGRFTASAVEPILEQCQIILYPTRGKQ